MLKSKSIKRPEWPKIRKRSDRGVYEVDAGTKLSSPNPTTGERKKYRKSFNTRAEAEVHAEMLRVKLRNEGMGGFQLSRAEQVDAERALRVLKDSGLTLTQVARYALKYHNVVDPDKTVNDLIEEFRQEKERLRGLGERGASDKTMAEYKSRHGQFAEAFGAMLVRDVEEGTFNEWLQGVNGGAASRRNMIRTTKALFSFAVGRGYVPENPIRQKIPKATPRKPAIFRDNEWRNLLLAAVSTDEDTDLLGYVTLGLFCGLRPESELGRLDWSDVHFEDGDEFVHVDAEKTKTGIGRHVTIPEAAKSLLLACHRREGMVVDPWNFRKRWNRLREQAGVLDVWKPDVMRHTFASMHYGLHRDKNLIRNELGHLDDSMLLHYVNHGTKIGKRAKEFFAFEAPSKAEILQLSASA